MGSLHRYPDQTELDIRGGKRRLEALREPSHLAGSGPGGEDLASPEVEAPPTLERWDLVESRWGLGSVVVLLAGAPLAVLGVVAVSRTGIDDTWYGPVAAVAGLRHTALLAGLEVGVGVLLVIAGLAGRSGRGGAGVHHRGHGSGDRGHRSRARSRRAGAGALVGGRVGGCGRRAGSGLDGARPHFLERRDCRAAGMLHAAAYASIPSPRAAQPVRTSSSAGWP